MLTYKKGKCWADIHTPALPKIPYSFFISDVTIVAAGSWRCPEYGWAFPEWNPETPRKRSQSKFWISRFRTVGDPQTLENKADSLSRFISENCATPVRLVPFPFLEGPPRLEQPELVMKFLTILGAPLRISSTATRTCCTSPIPQILFNLVGPSWVLTQRRLEVASGLKGQRKQEKQDEKIRGQRVTGRGLREPSLMKIRKEKHHC